MPEKDKKEWSIVSRYSPDDNWGLTTIHTKQLRDPGVKFK